MARSFSFPSSQTVRDQALNEVMGSSSSGLTALQTAGLLRKLDAINREFVNAAHIWKSDGAWSWIQDVTNFATYDDTTLDGAITTSSVSVILTSATNFDTAGRIWIKTSKGAVDFIDHTGKSSNTLTGATDIDIAHADDEKVGKLYALPSDYAKSRSLALDTILYTLRPQDALPVHGTFYTRGAYVVLPESTGAHDATLWYERTPTDLSTGVDATDLAASMNIPEDFMWYGVYMLMAHIQRTRRKRGDAVVSESLARGPNYPREVGGILADALSYDTSEDVGGVLFTDY